jgi:hypothetical protein
VTEFTSVSGSPYVVLVNGVPDGITHTSWHKAAEHAQKLEDAHPERDHEITRSERIRVENAKPTEVNGTALFTIACSDPSVVIEGTVKVTATGDGNATLTLVRV